MTDGVASRGAGEGGGEHGEGGRHEQRARHALDAAEDDERERVRGDRAENRGPAKLATPIAQTRDSPEDVAERSAHQISDPSVSR
jgi:hypothetical protein